MKHYRLYAEFVIAALAGSLLGALVQAGVAGSCAGYGGLIAAFGTVSYCLFFWTAVCSAVALRARCGLHAALLTFILLLATLVSYRFTAFAFGLYLNRLVLQAGAVLLLPAAGAAWFIRAFRDRIWMRPLLCAAGIGILLLDIKCRGWICFSDLRLVLPLLVMFIYSVMSAPGRDKRHSAGYRFSPIEG